MGTRTIFDSFEKRGVTTITHFANLSGKDVETLNVTEPQKQKLAYLMKKARCAVEGVDAFVQSRIEYPLVAKIEKNVNDGSNEKKKKKKKKARLRPYSSPPSTTPTTPTITVISTSFESTMIFTNDGIICCKDTTDYVFSSTLFFVTRASSQTGKTRTITKTAFK